MREKGHDDPNTQLWEALTINISCFTENWLTWSLERTAGKWTQAVKSAHPGTLSNHTLVKAIRDVRTVNSEELSQDLMGVSCSSDSVVPVISFYVSGPHFSISDNLKYDIHLCFKLLQKKHSDSLARNMGLSSSFCQHPSKWALSPEKWETDSSQLLLLDLSWEHRTQIRKLWRPLF